MSEGEFWSSTPRKFHSLAGVHIRIHSPEQRDRPRERLTLEELKSWR